MVYEPETYYLNPTRYAPNSELPVLVYRDCLPLPYDEEKTTEFLESHRWVKKGTWGHISIRHFHPNTHECYGVFQGKSIILVGCGSSDSSGGQEIEVRAGDVIVLPAGTAHCSIQSSEDYRYIGVYPEGAPKWRNEWGEQVLDHETLKKEIRSVARPSQDPVNGSHGPLLRLWTIPSRRTKL